jgi:predicted nuclease of predicted toxin-antitoxin system
MRILLDESIPARLGALLVGHDTQSVQKRGWSGLKNGKLLAQAALEFDVLLTADKGIEYQQNLSALPVAVVILQAKTNRLDDLARLVPTLLAALQELPPRSLQKVVTT